MPKLTDHELDKLFREMADRNVPEFDPADWEDMARRLDLEETAARARSKTLYAMVALLVIYLFVPKWGSDNNSQFASMAPASENIEQSPTVSTQDKKAKNGIVLPAETPLTTGEKEDAKVQTAAQRQGNEQKTGPASAAVSIIRQNKSLQESKETTIEHSGGNSDEHGNDRPKASTINANFSNEAIDGKAVDAGIEIGGNNKGLLYGIAGYGHYADIDGKVMLESSKVDAHAIVTPVQSEFLAEELKTIVKEEPARVTHQWFVKLPVSPDFSSIDYKKPGDPGINIGLLGEYQFGRHFSLSTGAIWSKKLYDTENPNKSYSSGNWSAKASKLDGDCRVLDIPINVTYYIFPERRTNLFVTVGASSYIMLKEQYVYTVWANQKEYQYKEEFSHKNNEWFSMLNLSIGIQQRIGKRFLLQGEPFLKAPMSGVGEGKVNLVSTGLFVSLKYQLTK